MTDTLDVAVNRNGLHTLEVQDSFEAKGPATVELKNHGEATHVHLNLDDRLSRIARIPAKNHYVESGERRPVDLEVREPEAWPGDVVRGSLKVVAAHGQETRYVDVIFDRTPEETPVEVDPELSRPHRDDDPAIPSEVRVVPVATLGLIAVVLAVGALVAADGTNFLLGGFSVLAGALCAAAAYYLLG